MSIHPSLSTSANDKKLRSVLKRTERLKILMNKGLWEKGKSIFALPKIKTMRMKIKKEKGAPTATAAGATSAKETTPAAETSTTKPES